MKSDTALFIVILLALCFCSCSCGHTPQVIWNWRAEVSGQNRDGGWYECKDKQPSLQVMRKTKRGNCVAFAALGAWHCFKLNLQPELVLLVSNREKISHAVVVVWEEADEHHERRLWIFDNIYAHVADWPDELGQCVYASCGLDTNDPDPKLPSEPSWTVFRRVLLKKEMFRKPPTP